MAKKWSGKSRGTVLGYKILIYTFRFFGRYPVYFLLYFIVFYYFLFAIKPGKITYKYLREIHGFSKLKSFIGVYRTFYALAISLVDKMVMFSAPKNPFKSSFDGEINLKKFSESEKGGFLLNAHVGNWELAGHFLYKYNITVNVVTLDAEREQIKQLMENASQNKNTNQHWKWLPLDNNGMEHVFLMKEALERKEVVCMTADRFVDDSKTITKNFLGKPAKFPLGPFQLAATFRAPMTMSFGFKTSASHYQFYGIPPIYPEEKESKNDYMHRMIDYYISQLEVKVRKYPYQWFNFYEFWEK